MSEITHEIDANFAGRLNILRAGVLGANDGIISIAGVVPTYLLDVWRWAADRTELLHGAQLEIEEVPALTQCLSCNKTYATVTYGRICPYCSSEKTELIQGLEIELAEIEAT